MSDMRNGRTTGPLESLVPLRDEILAEAQRGQSFASKIWVREAVDRMKAGEAQPKDFDHYLFEMVLEAVYGRDVWQWYSALPSQR